MPDAEPRDLAIEARAMSVEIKPDMWPDTRPLQQRAAASRLFTEVADELDALRNERDAALGRAEIAERNFADARVMTNRAQDERNRAQAALRKLRADLDQYLADTGRSGQVRCEGCSLPTVTPTGWHVTDNGTAWCPNCDDSTPTEPDEKDTANA